MDIQESNDRLFSLLAAYLSEAPDFITAESVKELTHNYGIDERTAVAFLLAGAMGLDIVDDDQDKKLFTDYFPLMLKKLSTDPYENDEYMRAVKFKPCKNQDWELNFGKFKPFELFVRDEPIFLDDGRVVPMIGYFDKEYRFPQVLQNGREWMMINPDELDTQKPYIQKAHGKVLTFGLGLGYYAFQCLLKDDVTEVVVVELDEKVISLFNQNILPYFPKNKPFRIVNQDAFKYAETQMGKEGFDYIFTDIWHDPSDGVELYLKMKECEKYSPTSEFGYWIEKTIKMYI